jgi:cyanophycinase
VATFLIGGGWSPTARADVYRPFLDAAGIHPTVACIVFDEGDGAVAFERWFDALTASAPCTPVPVLVTLADRFEVATLGDADAVLVCGGHTPSYAAALAPVAAELSAWLHDGPRPYAGFSAGAAIAARRALVGGWKIDGVVVCPEDAAEDLDEVSVVTGLGLVPFTIDVHAAQWGTVSRTIATVQSGRAASGAAIDEDTVLIVADGTARVAGLGRVHVVTSGDTASSRAAVHVRSWAAGDTIGIDTLAP